jgi:2-iminobutanoate/2-iminopropanoate deaminase
LHVRPPGVSVFGDKVRDYFLITNNSGVIMCRGPNKPDMVLGISVWVCCEITRNKASGEEKMAKHVIETKRGAPPGGAYSQGWRAGDFLFVTGTGPIDPGTGEVVGDSIEQQTEQTIDNICAILEADGASLRDVVKVNVHLSDTSLFARYNAVYARRFSQPYPVRTTVGSDLGHTPGMLLEIDCVAYSLKKQRSRPVHTPKKKGPR